MNISKFLKVACLLFLATMILYSTPTKKYNRSATRINWITNFDDALDVSVDENKPIMLYLYTDWCSYCKVLDREVYTNKSVILESTLFVAAKMNVEKDTEWGEPIKYNYGVQGYPAILFLHPETAEVLARMDGYLPADGLLFFMEKAYNNFY